MTTSEDIKEAIDDLEAYWKKHYMYIAAWGAPASLSEALESLKEARDWHKDLEEQDASPACQCNNEHCKC
jgi:hypothetical protein